MTYLQNISKRFGYLKEYPQLIVVFAGILLRLPLLSNSLAYGTDAWRQADTASIAHHFYVDGYQILYPQIFWGGSGPGYVETEFQLYPFIVSILYYFFGERYWLGKFVSLVFSVLAWLFFHRLAREVLGEARKATWALFILIFSPLYLRYSVAFMPEATVLYFYVAALFYFVSWLRNSRRRSLILASVFTAGAILVKPTSIHIGLVFALLALGAFGVKVLSRWEVWLSTAIALIPGVLWYVHARNLYLTYGNTFGLLSGGDSKFGNLSSLLQPHLLPHIAYLDLKWILGYGMIVLFLAGMVLVVKKKESRLIVFGVATVGLYYMIVPRYAHEEWGVQYHVYMLPFAAMAVGVGAAWISDQYKGFARAAMLWLPVVVSLGATFILFIQMLIPGESDLALCGGYVKALVPASARIIVSTTSPALDNGIPNNYQEPQIFFYSQRYGWSLSADQHTVEKLVEYRDDGAAYFVIYDEGLLNDNPSLKNYLEDNSMQIGPGIEEACAIFRLP